MSQLFIKGKVALVGAGSGDPELITVKGMRLLQAADVVLTDRLVSPEIIRQFVSPEAEVIYVGKQCRKGNSTPQSTINELMVIYAKEGKSVVRLKGGDVSIFSNILDELETLVENNIPYEIIPGVTAALGAAAYAGIPLTARGYSTAVRFLTAYKSDILTPGYWRELASTEDTLVFYMSAETLETVVAHLVSNGISEDKKIAVVEQATTPFQKIHISSLYAYKEQLKGIKLTSPALVIVGRVVSLHKQFDWFRVNGRDGEYFSTLYENQSKESLALTA
jgi:uroporphyrin-III C-methyltransferase/precorrin-2 dehydrogenase/sirohydrochlorin ferrochelatase/uroporphyrin-III C-methyltransferase